MSERETNGGPHEIPGMPPCICSACSGWRAGQAARIERGKAAAARELDEYKRRLSEALAGHKPLILPDTPIYGVTGPSLSSGCPPGGYTWTEVEPGTWVTDAPGHLLPGSGKILRGVPHAIDDPDEPPAPVIRTPAAPLPDCTCGHPQAHQWSWHVIGCPARTRLIEIHAADAAARREQDRARMALAGPPPEDPVDAWWREMRAISGHLTCRQMADRVPDQPPGKCTLCRYEDVIPGRPWCADCAEIADAEPDAGKQPGAGGGIPVLTEGRAHPVPVLGLMTVLGCALVVLAMIGFTPLIIPGIIVLGCVLSVIFKGEWR